MSTAPTSPSRRAGVAILVGVVLAGIVFAGLALFRIDLLPDFLSGEEFQDVGPAVVDSIQELSELTTVEMVEYTTISKGEDYGWLNWARGDRVFLFAVARVGAGVDLEKLTPESFIVDNEAGTVLVRLPAPEVFYSYLDNEATQVFDRDTGLLTKGDAQLESEARREAERLLVDLSLDEGILDQAQENAETTISNFLHGLGYTHVMIERSPTP